MATKTKVVWDTKGNRKEVDETSSQTSVPEHLRHLPSAFVTKDTSDPDKIHELDDPHIVEELTEQQFKKEAGIPDKPVDKVAAEVEKHNCAIDGRFDQLNIDFIKLRVINEMVKGMMLHLRDGLPHPGLKVHHLWFPKASLAVRELRRGNPPPDCDRPKHLRNLDLIIDPYVWPKTVERHLWLTKGLKLPNIRELELKERNMKRIML